jgi:hypothetical protein
MRSAERQFDSCRGRKNPGDALDVPDCAAGAARRIGREPIDNAQTARASGAAREGHRAALSIIG